MKNFKQFLAERSFSPHEDDVVSDADFYGEHKERSPKEFGKFIESLTGQMAEKEKKLKDMEVDAYEINPYAMWRHDNQRQLDYHITNPNLTDEHLHHAIPHLLSYDYEAAMDNLDIPWHVMKPHAELALAAFPNEKMVRAFDRRESYENKK
jgi:hypothetical protein